MRKVAKVANLSHQLRSHGLANASNGYDGLVFRQLSSQAGRLGAVRFHRAGNSVELCNRLLDQQLAGVRLGHQRELLAGILVNLDSLVFGEVVAMALAPLLVPLHKGLPADTSYAVHMPEGVYKDHPFLAAVWSDWTVKVPVHAGVTLLQQSDEIVVQRGLGGQLELPVKGLKFIPNRIYGRIVRQNLLFVNGKLSDLQGICPVALEPIQTFL